MGDSDYLNFLIYMPASFVCPTCNFQLEKRTMLASTRETGIRAGGESLDPSDDHCPNDGTVMRRVMWKQAYIHCAEQTHELMLALIESVKLQSHYARLLNMHDGGERMTFDSPAAWIERLKETGTIPVIQPIKRKGMV
jgi:hypothetical protein